jgi:hypothetical protein
MEEPSLEQLQKQLAELNASKNTISALKVPMARTEPPKSEAVDIERMINDAVERKIASVSAQPKQVTLLQVLGSALSEDDSAWLLDPKCLNSLGNNIALYLQEDKGQEFLKSLVKYLRKIYGH